MTRREREAREREHDARRQIGTVEAYYERWLRTHPRSVATEMTYGDKARIALKIKVGGRRLAKWRMDEVERSEINELVDHELRRGMAAASVRGMVGVLSAMWEDAIDDGWTRHNPARARIRRGDPRVTKPPRLPQVFSWEQMHAVAYAAPMPQAVMIRVLADTGLRLGEMLGLQRWDIEDGWLSVRRTARKGHTTRGTKTTRDCPESVRRVPLPPTCRAMLLSLPVHLKSRYVFAAPRGGPMHEGDHFYPQFRAACIAAGIPTAHAHDFRHSYVSLMRAAGVDPAHLAEWTGHSVLTATTVYTHAIGDASPIARELIG